MRTPLIASVLCLAAGAVFAQAQPVIGLITKTETNPFFVKMKEGAAEAAKAKGAKLLTGAGKTDGDNAGQIAHIDRDHSNAAEANSIRGRQTLRTPESSPEARRKLSGTRTMPVRMHAYISSKKKGWLWARIATRSPRSMPMRPARKAAVRSMRRSS